MKFRRLAFAGCVAAAAVLTACGGGTDGTGAPAPSAAPNATAFGVMTLGSVIVNGVRYDDANAIVRIDDRAAAPAELRNGMVVNLRGRLNADGISGSAERIEVENEVRAMVRSVDAGANPASFSVGGLTVLIEPQTVFENLSPNGPAGLQAGVTYVDVYGIRDASGRVRASRVEGRSRGGTPDDELRGTVSALGGSTFNLGAVQVTYAGASFSPAGATASNLSNGITVEVHGAFNADATQFTAVRIDLENLEDDAFRPRAGERGDIEGFVSGFDAAAQTFVLNGVTVRVTPATRYRSGGAADLANDVRVEVEARADGPLRVAEQITFKQSQIVLTGRPSAVDATARTMTLLGKTVVIDDLTDLRTPLAAITPNVTRIQVRAMIGSNGTLRATRVEDIGNFAGGRDEVQALVTAKNDAARTLVLLGITASLDGAGVTFESATGTPLSAAQFFAAIIPTTTVVKVKGRFMPPGTLIGEEAEIEN